jgi:hypothetical protein
MTQLHPTQLLTTRLRTTVAVGLTALLLALTILHWGHNKSGWLFTDGTVSHGWLPIALDVLFYVYFCWLGFWFIRGTKGLERLFMVGWSASILLSPLGTLRPHWAVATRQINAFGLAVALFAAVALLSKSRHVDDSNTKTDAR